MPISLSTLANTIIPDATGEIYYFALDVVKQTLRDFCIRTRAANRGIVHQVKSSDISMNDSIEVNTLASGSYLDDNGSSLSLWTDEDAGLGESTQTDFDDKETLKLYSGGAASVENYAQLSQVLSDLIPHKFVVSVNMYPDKLGNYADADYLRLLVNRAQVALDVYFAADGVFINNGVSVAEVGTNLVNTKQWIQWDFIVNMTNSSSATVDVYLNGVLQAAGVNCSYAGTFTANSIVLKQAGAVTKECTTYIKSLKVGPYHQYQGWDPVGIMRLTVDGDDYATKELSAIEEIADMDELEESYTKFWYLSTPTVLTMFPFDSQDAALFLRIAFQPTDNITELDDVFYRKWYDTIKMGAMSRILSLPGKVWSDAAYAKGCFYAYETGVSMAIISTTNNVMKQLKDRSKNHFI